MTTVITYRCENPYCKRIHRNPARCPECGCPDSSVYEQYEDEEDKVIAENMRSYWIESASGAEK